MAEMYADFGAIREVGQGLKNGFKQMSLGYEDVREQREKTNGYAGPAAMAMRTVDANGGAAKLLAYLYESKKIARGSKSLSKYDFPNVINGLINLVEYNNAKMNDIGTFLLKMADSYEFTEALLISRLGEGGRIDGNTPAWVSEVFERGFGDREVTEDVERHIGGMIGSAINFFLPGEKVHSPFEDSDEKKYSFRGAIFRYEKTTTRTNTDGSKKITTLSFSLGEAAVEGQRDFLRSPRVPTPSYRKKNKKKSGKKKDSYTGGEISASAFTASYTSEIVKPGHEHGKKRGGSVSVAGVGVAGNKETKHGHTTHNISGGVLGRFGVQYGD